jgi:hypothetical protein
VKWDYDQMKGHSVNEPRVKAMESFDLFSSHEFDSFWRFQGLDVSGRLFLSPQEIKLVLSGPREKIEPLRSYISERDGPLTGYALNGSELSLIKAFASGGSFYKAVGADSPYFFSVNVFANLCIVGRHLAAEDDPIPGELWLSFPLLIDWFRYSPYHTEIPTELDSPVLERLEIRDVGTILDAQLPCLRSRVRSFHSIGMTLPSFQGYCSNVQAFLYFGPDECNTAQRAVERAFSCTALWTAFCGAHVAPSRIFFQELVEGNNPPLRRTHIFVPLGELAPPDNHPGDLLLSFETIGDEIGPIVDAWLGGKGPPPDAINLFLRAFRQHRRHHFDHEVFRNLVTALEALANAKGVGDPAAAREQRAKQDKRTLNQKIASFSSLLPPEVAARFPTLREPRLGQIVATRNYYAHGGGRSDPRVLREEELFQATDQLQLLVLLLLLRAAGVPADMVMTRMLRRWDCRQILERGLKEPRTD